MPCASSALPVPVVRLSPSAWSAARWLTPRWSSLEQAPLVCSTGHSRSCDTSDWEGKFRPKQRLENDYLVDRERQKTESYTGIGGGFIMQDQAATESMGAVTNRTREHLGVSDAMIIRTRKRMLDAMHALEDSGVVPPGVDEPEVYGTRSGWLIMPSDADWWEGSQELRAAYVERHDEAKAVATLQRS